VLQVNDHRVVVQDLHVVEVLGVGLDGRSKIRGGPLQGVFHILGGHLLSVVKHHVLAKMHLVGRVRRKFPGFRESGANRPVTVEEDQRVVDGIARPGTRHIVVTDGIHGRGIVLIRHDEGVLGPPDAAKTEDKNRNHYCKNASFHSVLHCSVHLIISP
jgi:hypothetical protein